MGRTLPTYNTFLQQEMDSWRPFRRALRAEEKDLFDRLFTHARTYAAEGTCAARPVPFDAIVLAMMLGQEREMQGLREELDRLRARLRTLEEEAR